MPTPSGRETADERRDRQATQRWAHREEAREPFMDWARDEAADFVPELVTLRDTGKSYEQVKRSYEDEAHADAFSVALKELGISHPSHSIVFEIASGSQPYHQVGVYQRDVPADL